MMNKMLGLKLENPINPDGSLTNYTKILDLFKTGDKLTKFLVNQYITSPLLNIIKNELELGFKN